MEALYSKEIPDNTFNEGIWKAANPREAARVLLQVYGQRAVVEAFKREIEAHKNDDLGRTIFWMCVQDFLCRSFFNSNTKRKVN